ncbi:Sulfotransferase [Candidatus Magnetoovum chiemensis]|nr:Sulfotransferase [Candidatus Magnetoovum chiemensis]
MVSWNNYSHIRPNDIILASYPRSGNTWVMNLLLCLDILVLEGYQHDLSAIKSAKDVPSSSKGLLPALEQLKAKGDADNNVRVIKTHSLPLDIFKKAIYIYRDGRDSVLSYYHYSRRFEDFTGSFLDFLRGSKEPVRAWAEHVRQWLDAGRHMTAHYVRYEDLLYDTTGQTRKLAHFAGIQKHNDCEIEKAVSACSFDRLKRSETEKIGKLKDNDLYFFRKGCSGQWKEAYDSEHIELFNSQAGNILDELSYL